MAWMSEEQAATALGVSFRTIRRRVGNGSLRSMRQGSDLFVDVEVAGQPERRPRKAQSAAAKPEITPAVVPIDLPSSSPEAESAPTPGMCEDASRGPVNATTVTAPTFAPTNFGIPRAPQSIHPAHAMPLMPAPMTKLESPASSFFGTPAVRTTRRSGRWAGPVIWSLITVTLLGATSGAWFIQHNRMRIGDLESKLSRASSAAQQSQAAYEKQMQARAATASVRETRLQSELLAARSDVDRLTQRLSSEEREASALQASLSEATARIASLDLQRADLSRGLALARASMAVLKTKATLVDSLQTWAGQWEQPFTSARTHTLVTEPPSMPAVTRAEERQPRRLPSAAPTLGEEDQPVELRAIVQE